MVTDEKCITKDLERSDHGLIEGGRLYHLLAGRTQ